jgi:hypothetical protein
MFWVYGSREDNGAGGLVPESGWSYTPAVQFTTFAVPVVPNECRIGAGAD